MTDKEILKLVEEYFKVGGIQDDGSCSEYYGKPDTFVKFARTIRNTTWTQCIEQMETYNPENECWEMNNDE